MVILLLFLRLFRIFLEVKSRKKMAFDLKMFDAEAKEKNVLVNFSESNDKMDSLKAPVKKTTMEILNSIDSKVDMLLKLEQVRK
jgi:hypothetical protein